MTLREKQLAMLHDLFCEYNAEGCPVWWQARLTEKIADLRAAIEDNDGQA